MIKPIDVNEDKYPNSKAVIGYENVLITAIPFEATAALTLNTYEGYLASAGSVEIDFIANSASDVEYVGLVFSGLADGQLVSVDILSGATVLDSFFGNVKAGFVMFSFDSIEADGVRVTYASTGTELLTNISAGKALKMTQPIYGGHAPVNLNTETKYVTNTTVKGNFIGRTVENKYGSTEYSWRHIDSQWYRDNFIPFRDYAIGNPFFIQWRPDYHPEDGCFCWTAGDIKAVNMGMGTTLLTITMSVESYNGI